MSLTPREAFKYGFLARCVEAGLTPVQMQERVKEAFDKLAGLTDLATAPLSAGLEALKGAGKLAWGAGVPALLAAPPILGGLAGYGLSRATDINEKDVPEVKNDELIDEYKRQTDLLRRVQAVRDARKARKRSGRLLL